MAELNIEEILTGFFSDDKAIRLKAIGEIRNMPTATSEAYKERLLGPLLAILEADEDPEVRASAAKVLGLNKYKEALEPLIKAVDSEFLKLREDAIDALARLEDERALPTLLKAATDSDSSVRSSAIIGLFGFRNEQVFQTLLSVLKNDPDSDVREYAAFSLGYYADPRSIEPLLTALRENAPNPELGIDNAGVRVEIAGALSRFKDPRLFEPLFALLSDPDEWVHPWALDALSDLGDARALEAVLAILNDPTRFLLSRIRAAEALGFLHVSEERVIESLVNVLDETENNWNGETVGQSAFFALGRLGEPGLQVLLEMIHSTDINRRDNAIYVLSSSRLSQYRDSRVIETLKEAYKNKSNFSGWAIYALEKSGILQN